MASAVELRPIWNIVGEFVIGPVKDEPKENGTLLRCQVINASKSVVLVADVRIIHERLARGGSGSRRCEELRYVVRQRIKRHRVPHGLADSRVGVLRYRRAAGATCCRCEELMRAGVRNCHDIRVNLLLAQPFVVPKKKRLVPLDGTAEAAAELVLPDCRWPCGRVSGLDAG